MRTKAEILEERKSLKAQINIEKDPVKAGVLGVRMMEVQGELRDFNRSLAPGNRTEELSPENRAIRDMLTYPDQWFPSWVARNGVEYRFDAFAKGLYCFLGSERIDVNDLSDRAHMAYSIEVTAFQDVTRDLVKKIETRDFNTAVDGWVKSQHDRCVVELYETIRYDASQDDSELERWYTLLTGRMVDPVDMAVLKQVMVNVKRKMLGLPVRHPMMAVLYSRENGTGKSGFLHTEAQSLLAPFARGFKKEIDMEIMGDQTVVNDWSRYFIYVLEELAGADRTDSETLKARITSPTVSGRQAYARGTSNVPNNVTVFGCSNKRLSDVIRHDRMRRFWEIECSESKYVYRSAADKAAFDAMDPLKMWRCVDEHNAAGYFEAHAREIDERQTDLCTPEPHDVWMRTVMIVPKEVAVQVPSTVVYAHYRSWAESNGHKALSNLTLGKKLKEAGVRSVVRTEAGMKVTMYLVDAGSAVAVGHHVATSHITSLI